MDFALEIVISQLGQKQAAQIRISQTTLPSAHEFRQIHCNYIVICRE